jgi:hypothetical protein
LEFDKAFEKIEHQAIVTLLKARGIGDKWIAWIEQILSSKTCIVLLNGVIGKTTIVEEGSGKRIHFLSRSLFWLLISYSPWSIE